MEKLVLVLIILLMISSISAIRITEVEMNPIEGKNGIEWIELYNDESSEKDISAWEIWEGVYGSSGPKIITIIPNGIIIPNNEFYIVEWGGAKLNNGGDFVILYDSSGNKIDETKTQKESSSSTKTWQLCEIWEFKESTKGEKNDCEETPEEPEESSKEEEEKAEENNETLESIEDIDIQNNPIEKSEELKDVQKIPAQLETIKLNTLSTKTIKSEDNKEDLNKSKYAKYGFVVFCVLLGFLFILKKKKSNRTEFEGNEE